MNIIFCFLIAFTLNAQDVTGLLEIDPAKDAVLLRKLEEKKLLKMMAEKKKAEALKAENKRKEDEKIAAEEKKKAELVAAEEKKKKEVEATTRWLISERDRKMKEAAEAEARKAPPVESKSHSVSGNLPRREIHRIQTHGTDYPITVFPPPQCSFPKNTKFPADVKVLGIATYEGTFPGGRGFRNHPMTDVTLNVQEQGSVALVLWTYEPIRWTIKMNGGSLVGVLVVGYHEQKIIVDNGAPTIVSFFENGKNQCQYSENNYDQQMDYQERAKIRLSKFSQTLFAKPLASYQYMYTLPPEVKVPEQN